MVDVRRVDVFFRYYFVGLLDVGSVYMSRIYICEILSYLCSMMSVLFLLVCCMYRSSHSWETLPDESAPPPRRTHSWEADWDPEHVYESDSDSEDVVITPEDEFIAFNVSMLLERTLNARQFCITMHWAGQAPGWDKAKRLGYPPDQPSGHYNRHLMEN